MTMPDGFWSEAEQVIAGVDKLNACLLQVGNGEPPDWMIAYKNLVYRDEDSGKIWRSNGTSMEVIIDSNGAASSPSLRSLSTGGAAAFGHGHIYEIASKLETIATGSFTGNTLTRISDASIPLVNPGNILTYNTIESANLTYTSTGNQALIVGVAEVLNPNTAPNITITVRVVRGSTVICSSSIVRNGDSSPYNAGLVIATGLDIPGSGSFTYNLQIGGLKSTSHSRTSTNGILDAGISVAILNID